MTRRKLLRLRSTSAVAAVLASVMLFSAMLAGPASAATPVKKMFAANIIPVSAQVPSTSAAFTFTLLNEAKNQVIDAANITPPAEATIDSVGTLVSDGKKARASLVGNTIQLRGLSLLPGDTATLMFNATLAATAGSYAWGVDVRQSNDFGGTGNVFVMDLTNSHLSGIIVQCDANTGCSGSISSATTTADVSVDSGGTASTLTIALLPTNAIQCFIPSEEGSVPYVGTSDTVQFDVSATDRTKTVTITIPASLVGGRSFDSFQVCYSSNMTFTDLFGNPIAPGDAGILPPCFVIGIASSVQTDGPCLLDRTPHYDESENLVSLSVSFFAPAGDPKGHI